MKLIVPLLVLAAMASVSCSPKAESIGEVDTVFKLLGPDHKIVVDAYDDPKVEGVTCYVSRAKTGGIKGGLGLAEDKAEASIACRQVGPIAFPKPLETQEEMFTERISLVFKKLRVVRMVDRKRNSLVYLTYFRPGDRGLAAEQRRGGRGRPGDADPGEVRPGRD
jgi:CreA protein